MLLVTMHHIVSDGWSMGVLIAKLTPFMGLLRRGSRIRCRRCRSSMRTMRCGSGAGWTGNGWNAGRVLEASADGSAGVAGVAGRPAAPAAAAGLCGAGVEVELDGKLTRQAEAVEPAARGDVVHDAAGGMGGAAGAAVGAGRKW